MYGILQNERKQKYQSLDKNSVYSIRNCIYNNSLYMYCILYIECRQTKYVYRCITMYNLL